MLMMLVRAHKIRLLSLDDNFRFLNYGRPLDCCSIGNSLGLNCSLSIPFHQVAAV